MEHRDVVRRTLDAIYLSDCYRMDANDAKNMSPDQVSFMLEADEYADAILAELDDQDDEDHDDRT